MSQVTTLTDHNGTRLIIEKRPPDIRIIIELPQGMAYLFFAKNEDMPELINTLCAYYDDPDGGESKEKDAGIMQLGGVTNAN
jgi:hypothetical protein